MGTPEFAVPTLARLIEDGHEVAAVFTQPDKPAGRGKHLQAPPVKTFALEKHIAVYQPAKIKINEEARAVFESVAPDACVVAAYGKILPEWMLKIPRLGCINVHASLLPKYRGAAPINWAIANGESVSGVTIMQMDVGLDTGPMLAKRATRIGEEETAVELSARLASIGADALSETLIGIERGEIEPEKQNDEEASFAPMLKREDGLIDWQIGARQIANRVRGFQPWPGTYTRFRGGRLIIWRARPVEFEFRDSNAVFNSESNRQVSKELPATILKNEKHGIIIACAGPSTLLVEEVQVEGKRKATARDFANGARLSLGDRISEP